MTRFTLAPRLDNPGHQGCYVVTSDIALHGGEVVPAAEYDALAASHARLLAACRKMKDNEVAALTNMASDAENEAFVDGWMEMEAVIAQAPKEPT